MTMEKGTLSSEIVKILTEYNRGVGLVISVPFRASDIRKNDALLTSSDICVSARIVQAFAGVNFIYL
jgi:hypothetical protein